MTDWLSELDRLEREATPGPWERWVENQVVSRPGGVGSHWVSVVKSNYALLGIDIGEPDLELVLALRNHARELIDAYQEIQELRESIKPDETKMGPSVRIEDVVWHDAQTDPPKVAGWYAVIIGNGPFRVWWWDSGFSHIGDEVVTHWAEMPRGPR